MIQQQATEIATIKLGQQERQLLYRPGTSDQQSILQVFRDQQYNINRLRRGKELIDYMKRQEGRELAPLIVDAGAYIGGSAVYFSSLLPSAHVVAIEPHPGNFDILSRNIAGASVEPMRVALASKVGHVRVTDPGQGLWGMRTELNTGEIPMGELVPTVTINDIYASHTRCFPFIVKIDVEGFERDIFSANTEWVAKTPLIIVELHDWLLTRQGTATPFLRCISALDRDCVLLGEENVFSISNSLTKPEV